MSVLNLGIQLLLSHHVQVHNVADVEVKDPVLRVFHAECVPYIELKALVAFQIRQLLKVGEGYLESASAILKVLLPILLDHILITIYRRNLALILELFHNASKFLQEWVSFDYQRL